MVALHYTSCIFIYKLRISLSQIAKHGKYF